MPTQARFALIVLVLTLLLQPARGQEAEYLAKPFGPAHAVVSPDGLHSLWGDYNAAQLWMEDVRTHERRLVAGITVQTLTLAWSPDSAAFLVNDRPTSTTEIAYLYDTRTLERLDLRSRIVSADPSSHRFFVPGQLAMKRIPARYEKVPTLAHVHALRWTDANHVEVQLVGHTAGVAVGDSIRPAICFDLRYRISRTGTVRRSSRQVLTATPANCIDR